MKKKKIIINTDLGDDVDDGAAIALALQSPEIEILGITTVFKNTRARADMVRDLLAFYHREDIPVYAGFGMPIIERPDVSEFPIQYDILRKSYNSPASPDEAVDFIIRTVSEDQEVTVIEMGPQTNLAHAFLRAPEIMKKAKIIGMGGAFLNSCPEWNILCDPEAARIVTDFAGHLIMFGLDVTKYCKLSSEQLKKLQNTSKQDLQYMYKGMQLFMNKTGLVITLHDVLLIAYLIDESVAALKQEDYTVELKGELTRGTILHKSSYYELENEVSRPFYYAVDLDINKFMDIVIHRLFNGSAEI